MALFLLINRRFSSRSCNLHKSALLSFYLSPQNPKSTNFSSLSSLETETKPTTVTANQPKPSSLSARMSFVFDQIDAIERERSQKDETLQRIRAWRESKNKNHNNNNNNSSAVLESELKASKVEGREKGGGLMNKAVELVHPWPEWIELMERLVQQNYFDHKRKDEDKMAEDLGFDMSEVVEEGFDFTRDWKTVQTACLNFGKDRFDILRSLSRQDIQVLVGYGCPSADKKVVFSAKLLRKHVHLDEGDVCSSCSLRSSCERGYLLTNKEDEARTIDIMRVLLTYGFDPVNGSVVNESLLKIKSVKTVVRKLLHQVVKLSSVPIDPNLPPPIIKKPPPKVKQPPPPPRKRVGRDDIEMKKGDWLCPKCDFMNFAKNSVCLQCDANRPKRQLLPGEWECPECNFLNYRRNVVCFHCECKRPADEFMENKMQERQRGPRTMPEKISSRKDAWNFDFDDNESDGADVAAFEYADSHKLDEDFPQARRPETENNRTSEEGFHRSQRPPMAHEREFSNLRPKQPGTGFDDFDEEEDDLESYELDTQSRDQVQKTASIDFSELEVNSDSDDTKGNNDNWRAPRTNSPRNVKASKPRHRNTAFSGSEVDELDFDSDEEVSVHRNWKSSHVADSRQRPRGRGAITYGSDEDIGPSSGSEGDENFRSRQNKGNKGGSSRRDFGRRANHNSEDFSGSESDGENLRFRRDKGTKTGFDRRRNISKGRGGFDVSENSGFKSRGTMRDRKSPLKDKFDRSSQGPRGHDRGFRGDDYDGRRKGAGGGNLRNFKSPKRENFGNRERGRGQNFDNQSTGDGYLDDERHRRPRENVR